ncbi:SIS domain-containing protein [Ornithinimicrobium sp. W1665]|uniref:SIS domain-containing protein n=1 Tax=Ornithinimicrobium sp. W1665 TaxID=3416666 RepID=UPI003CF9FBD5
MTSHLETELSTQPDVWAEVVDRSETLLPPLPARGQRVAAVGCGTSWFMAQAYAALRESRGHGVTDAFAASEFPRERDYDKVVLITRSGTTTEVIEVMRDLRERGVPHVAIVATPGTQVAEQAQECVLLDFADEQSVVQTRFATAALGLLRLSVGDDLSAAIADAREILRIPREDLFPASLTEVEQVTFLGRGWSVGLANEAGLKLRESVQFWTEAYPAMEYRHGPISIAAPGRAVWTLDELPEGLADSVTATGAELVTHPGVDPMAELVRVHRYCVVRAELAGVDPDQPRNLTRSIVLS